MFITVKFENHGREYVYNSPIQVAVGDHVVVNVFGNLKCVEVIEINASTSYTGECKDIVGIISMLEDLVPQPQLGPSITKRIVNALKELLC